MSLTIPEIHDKLLVFDEVTLLEILNINAEDIIEAFQDRIEEMADRLEEMLEDDDIDD